MNGNILNAILYGVLIFSCLCAMAIMTYIILFCAGIL